MGKKRKKNKNNVFYDGKKFLKNKFRRHINAGGMCRKIRIVVERKDGKKIIIPLTKYEVFMLSDLPYMMHDDSKTQKILDLNHIDLNSFWEKIFFLEYDVINDGICYKIEDLIEDKKKKEVFHHYLVKKPKWV